MKPLISMMGNDIWINYMNNKKHYIFPIIIITSLFSSGILQCFCESQDANIEGNTMTQSKSISISDMKITIEIYIPKNIIYKAPIYVEGRIRNVGNKPVMIYMPGISIFPRLIYNQAQALKNPVRPDEFGLPCLYGRAKSDEEDLNYVMLEPEEYYGRKYKISPLGLPGREMSFTLTYDTDKAIKELRLKGKFSVESDTSKIYPPKE